MFVIAHNESVILGPMRWNKYRFENEIQEECEVTTSLPQSNESDVINVSEDVKIYPVIQVINEECKPRVQFLNGPYWKFTETGAIAKYVAEDMAIDAVKNMMKAECATERWRKENAGTKMTIQDTEVSIDTSRESRNVFAQKYIAMNDTDTVQWKFPEAWLTLSKVELQQVIQSASVYVQEQFDWESSLVAEIDSSETLEQLEVIVIVEPQVHNNVLGVM